MAPISFRNSGFERISSLPIAGHWAPWPLKAITRFGEVVGSFTTAAAVLMAPSTPTMQKDLYK